MRRILVLGNGFDLAHGLPTQYKDFLYSCSYVIDNPIFDEIDVIENLKIARILFCNKLSQFKINKVEIKNNIWLNYFYRRYKDIGEGWIDFEREIKEVCDYFAGDGHFNDRYDYFVIPRSFKDPKLDEMIAGLKQLIKILDCYLSAVNDIKINKFYKQIIDFMPTDVITLNYTKTFERVYYDSNNVCFLHGELSNPKVDESGEIISNSINSIVLGFNSLDNKSMEDNYCEFLKYYQMVNNDVDVSRYCSIQNDDNNVVMFFGHSLDVTDDSLVRTLIEHSKKVFVLYHDDKSKAQEIRNLTKVLGRNKFEELTLTNLKRIFFIKQEESIEFEDKYYDDIKPMIKNLFDFCFNKKSDKYDLNEYLELNRFLNVGKLPLVLLARNVHALNHTIGNNVLRFSEEDIFKISKLVQTSISNIITDEILKSDTYLSSDWSKKLMSDLGIEQSY